MNLSLGQFQDAFVEALYQRPAPALADLSKQPAFAVYRNTVLKGCVDALHANFPALERLAGSQWMQDAASAYALRSPPTDARLIHYGAAFPAFLDELEHLDEWPWLPDVARLDHDWLMAFRAPDDAVLTLAALAGHTASDLASRCLVPRRGARWRWFETHPVYSLWRHGRDELAWHDDIPWHGEGVLLIGSAAGVCHQPLEAGGCAFLEACAGGHCLDRASTMALQVQADLDFTDLLGRLLRAGVFVALD